MDSWKIFCAKNRTRKQKILVEQREERLELLQKQREELESLDNVHKQTLEELKEMFERDRIERKNQIEKCSKKASVLSIKKRKRKIEYLADNDSESEIDQKSSNNSLKSKQRSITKYLRTKLSRAANSIELIKNKTSTEDECVIQCTQPCDKSFDSVATKDEESDDEEVQRIIDNTE